MFRFHTKSMIDAQVTWQNATQICVKLRDCCIGKRNEISNRCAEMLGDGRSVRGRCKKARRPVNKVGIFVSCHQRTRVPQHPLLIPMQVGAALTDKRFSDIYHDDVGDNISRLNRSYCELTTQYWAWKNIDLDYYGFFHYRRYLYPNENIKAPYRIEYCATNSALKHLHYESFEKLILQYDIIVPIGEDMHISVRDHYSQAPFHHQSDMKLIENIIEKQYPEYSNSLY